MPKPRTRSGGATRGSRPPGAKSAQPDTEIAFLNAADEQEKGGHKWKAGDAVKAARFFSRALDLYNQGLQKFPASFDLAYNKAHLAFELAQDPRIAPRLGPRPRVLDETLAAHRYALRLNEDNPDVLFNTAQVLTSLAEDAEDASPTTAERKQTAVQSLQEAVELFGACLNRQEMLLYELQSAIEGSEGVPDRSAAPSADVTETRSSPSADQWATVEEPVTGSIILDTAVALLSCLESLLAASVPAESSTLAAISEIANPLVYTKIPSYVSLIPETAEVEAHAVIDVPTLSISSNSSATFTASQRSKAPSNPRFEARMEAGLAIASFNVAVAEAEYRSQLSTLDTFASRLRDAYEPILNDRQISTRSLSGQDITEQDVEATVAYAEAYNSTLVPAQSESGSSMTSSQMDTVLQGLVTADELLSFSLSTFQSAHGDLPGFKNAQIQLLRGDVGFRRYKVMKIGNSDGQRTSEVLQQAQKLYQLAADQAKHAHSGETAYNRSVDPEEVRKEALFKSQLTTTLMTMDTNQFRANAERVFGADQASDLLRDIVQEGLIDENLANQIWTTAV